MMHRIHFTISVLHVLWCTSAFVCLASEAAGEKQVHVGVAKVDITPSKPVVLAGYGGRQGPFQGIDNRLWARALVLGKDRPAVIVAVDNCGVTRPTVDRLRTVLAKHGIHKDRIVVAVTHTHNAPSLTGYAPILWKGRTTAEQDRLTADYTQQLVDKMAEVVVKALEQREPMNLGWAQGKVTFGRNRRVIQSGRWAGFGVQQSGPVDHSLPILVARDKEDRVRAVWANYACHCTTVGSRNYIGGDWAGAANASMEQAFPEAISLMTIGCGADVGPHPGGNQKVADEHGQSIAKEVKRLIDGGLRSLAAAPIIRTQEIRLPLKEPQPLEHWQRQSKTAGGFHRQLARHLVEQHEQTGSIPSDVRYPITVWQFDEELAMVFLAGEVVVDYAVKLKSLLNWDKLWLTAWANDMPGYIPSRRVLAEGGYEAEFSQVYYGWPGPYDDKLEAKLLQAVTSLVGGSFAAKADQKPAPFHRPPSGESVALKKLKQLVASTTDKDTRIFLQSFRKHLAEAGPGMVKLIKNDGEATEWHNYAGDFSQRYFIRQMKPETDMRWKVRRLASSKAFVTCFSGGIGWETQPKTDGFELQVGGSKLKFDVTRKHARWASSDGSLSLFYLPTWTSDVDSAGFFILIVGSASASQVEETVVVRSLGKGSQRWFAIDAMQDYPARLKKISAALK